MEIPLPGSAVSGSRCIKQIYTAPDCHKRHAAYRGARHRDRAFVAVKRVRADRFHNFVPPIAEGRRRKINARRKKGVSIAPTSDNDLVPGDEKSPRKREKESADRSRGGQEAAGTRG